MGKTIEVRLSDAQHAQLTAEAEASGKPFFGYCREKLTARLAEAFPPSPANPGPRPTLRAAEPDRIDRLETMMLEMGRTIQNLANPAYVAEPQVTEPFDVDALVNTHFAEAEANGLAEHIPSAEQEVMQAAGVRPLSRRPIKYSTTPRHLQGL